MHKKRAFLTVFFLFFTVFNLSADNGRYIENVGAELTDKKEYVDATYYIPMNVKYAVDTSGSFTCDNIPPLLFRTTTMPLNTGFHKGTIWLDIEFLDTQEIFGPLYNLCFNNEFIYLAEVFIKDKISWKFYGRTGRSLLRSQMTAPTWDLNIPINEANMEKEALHHMRIKLITYTAPSIYVSLIPNRLYGSKYTASTALSFFTAGIFLLIIMVLIAIGAGLRDKLYILISFTAFFHLLMTLEQKGFGPVYLWNGLAASKNGIRLLYIFSISFITSLHVLLSVAIMDEFNSKKDSSKVLEVISTSACAFTAVVTLFSPSPVFTHLLFLACVILTRILLIIRLVITRNQIKKPLASITLLWIPLILLTIIINLCGILRAFHHLRIFDFICNSSFTISNISFISLTLPPLYLIFMRSSIKTKAIQTELKNYKTQSEVEKDRNDSYLKVCMYLISSAESITNTINLTMEKNTVEELKHYHSILKYTGNKIYDYLVGICTLNEGLKPKKEHVNLLSLFYECVSKSSLEADRKGIHTATTAVIPSDCFVVENRNSLSLMMNIFLSLTVDMAQKNSRIEITLRKQKEKFNLISYIKFSGDTLDKKDIMVRNFETSEKIQHIILKKLFAFYKGSITATSLTSEIKLEGIFSLDETEYREVSEIQQPPKNPLIFQERKVLPQKIHGTDSSILFIDDDLGTRTYIEEVLGEVAAVLFSANLENAKTEFSQYNPTPGLIIINGIFSIAEKYSFIRYFSATPGLQTVPIICVMENPEADKIHLLEEEKNCICVIKPLSSSDYRMIVKSILIAQNKLRSQIMTRLQNTVLTAPLTASQPAVKFMEKKEDIPDTNLTRREKNIMAEILKGKSDKEIARDLNISVQTVMTHNKNIFKKLNVHSRVELINKVR